MILAKVIGNVTTSVKHPILVGHKLLIAMPIDPESAGVSRKGKAAGKSVVALDVVQAGIGDTVLIIDEGNSGRMILGDSTAPVRSVIAGIVDSVDKEGS